MEWAAGQIWKLSAPLFGELPTQSWVSRKKKWKDMWAKLLCCPLTGQPGSGATNVRSEVQVMAGNSAVGVRSSCPPSPPGVQSAAGAPNFLPGLLVQVHEQLHQPRHKWCAAPVAAVTFRTVSSGWLGGRGEDFGRSCCRASLSATASDVSGARLRMQRSPLRR